MSDSLSRLLDLLDLEQIEVNIFRGRSPHETLQRVFGGQVAGQALVAAGRTVPDDRPVHSLHAYFIRPGDPAVPLVYTVDQVRDGRSFSTRRVTAIQHGKAIFTLSASFHRAESGVEHADSMPLVPPPDEVRPSAERLEEAIGMPLPPYFRDSPIDLRAVGPLSIEASRDPSLRTTRNLVWLRVNGELPDDPLLHVCLMTYASDLTLLDTVLLGHGLTWYDGLTSGASLDHAMWFHRTFRADQWLLYAQESPIAYGGRGLARGEVFTADGDLVVSVVQEGLIRTTSKPPPQVLQAPAAVYDWRKNCRSKICCRVVCRYVGLRHVRGPECRPVREEVPTVLINTFSVAVSRGGAELPGVRSPWANPYRAGVNHALAQLPGSAVVMPSTRFVAPRHVEAMVQPLAVMAAGLPIDIRKQYVHKTRVNAGGDGASGPHPEREPA